MRPILLVHGIWNQSSCFDQLRDRLLAAQLGPVSALDLVPNDGSVRIATLAKQIETAVDELHAHHGATVDLVGFSMGALASRYYVQRLSGRARVRRFVSISGPHEGTAAAYVLPFEGGRDMRPRSALVNELRADPDPWGNVEVHVLYTPFDLAIVPATSSRLPRVASETKLPVALHRWMLTDRRAAARVIEILTD